MAARFTIRDLLASLLILMVVVFSSLAATNNLDTANRRSRCAANLREIGQGMLLYFNNSKGSLPRTRYDPATADKPTAFTGINVNDPFSANGPGPNDVSAAVFLLLRRRTLRRTFSSALHPALNRTHMAVVLTPLSTMRIFRLRRTSAIATRILIPPHPTPAASAKGYKPAFGDDPNFVLAADINPGSPGLTQLTTQSTGAQCRDGNSPNHSCDGQNVLYEDGHVEFQNNPLAGSSRDNIFTFGDSGMDPKTNTPLPTGSQGIWGSPVSATDSVLLPAIIVPVTDATAAAASTPPVAPAAAAPFPPIDPGTDMTEFVAVTSIVLLAALALVVLILILKRRRSRANTL